jgi:hypothetical protein
VTRMEDKSAHKPKEAEAVKKPYRKPELRFERVFEVMALVCGKVFNTQLSCRGSRKAS